MAKWIEYNGFKLVVTVERQSSEERAARWRGHFGFWREDGNSRRQCSVSRTEASADDAHSKTLRIAKSIIDAEQVRQTGVLAVGMAEMEKVFLPH